MVDTQRSTEQKVERFYRVAERRTNNVLKALKLLGQCSNTRVYEYTDDDVQRMFREIERELRNAKQSFATEDQSKQFRFGD